MSRRADIEILRAQAEKHIANAAADEVGDELMLMKTIQNAEGVGIDLFARQ